ncbi:glutamate--cysteine ligase [Oceanobacter sp. 5_MG-2023]|uniref:glutamate--cysteine ligase n=1 Tax=Oceanobacter sp. 5_MG-2023 TaxID=3062645 RepID=UPI0026E25B72|nr:glutamate--cysteine ligase [Oceanobacter sp. 5_MG-2023]MDO6680755.1 glutamate--cysteine ligase [Oceanobacter sp. 5_MG-2023]
MATTTLPRAFQDTAYRDALALLQNPQHAALLTRLQRGIEKEGLRCNNDGIISQKPHPTGLGSTLTHPSITTDYSEALLEFITPVYRSGHEAIACLDVAHRFAFSQMDAELIWPSSMPCILEGEMSIPIATYGSSNLGQLKHVYRHGLWHRYGRTMQCIAGIHYNFSLPDELWPILKALDNQPDESLQDFISRRYFGLIRNFRRYSWLLLYLFGASPAVCSSFLAGREHNLDTLHKHTLYLPYATSLRMSDLGYQNNAQSSLRVCYNSVENYVETLGDAINVQVDDYEKLGVQDQHGVYQQLNTHLLQIENEFYSDIRPKRIAKNDEKPLEALNTFGVEYIEVRNTDLNPFMPVGIDVPQTTFMDLFLCYCLLQSSDTIEDDEYLQIQTNQQRTVMRGREPGLTLLSQGQERNLQQWGLALLDDMQALAQQMDSANQHSFHIDSLGQQRLKLADAAHTPSAKVLAALQEQKLEFSEFTLQQARQHRKALSQPLAPEVHRHWQALARQSLQEQAQIEASDTLSFEDFLADYLQR